MRPFDVTHVKTHTSVVYMEVTRQLRVLLHVVSYTHNSTGIWAISSIPSRAEREDKTEISGLHCVVLRYDEL